MRVKVEFSRIFLYGKHVVASTHELLETSIQFALQMHSKVRQEDVVVYCIFHMLPSHAWLFFAANIPPYGLSLLQLLNDAMIISELK